MDWPTYRSFSVFDRLIRTGSWRRPVLFLVVFVALAVVSFSAAAGGKRGAWLLGGVLLAVGLVFPGAHFARYALTLKQLRARLGLKDGSRPAYTLALGEDSGALVVRAPKQEEQRFAWEKLYGVWLRGQVIYIYVEAGKAYILPLTQIPARAEEAIAYLRGVVPAERFHA
mgnify:FL=1